MFAVEVAYIITAFILPVLSTFLNPVIIFSFGTNYVPASAEKLSSSCLCQVSTLHKGWTVSAWTNCWTKYRKYKLKINPEGL